MAKLISTIAPVEQLRGNLSGKQTLKYRDNNNSAFEAPEGKQYAVNYRKSYIGCMRQRDGLAYFQVKTKNCVNVTAESKKRMAVSGGAFAIVASIMRQKATIFTKLVNILAYAKLKGDVEPSTTLRQYISEPIMNALRHGSASVIFTIAPAGGPSITATILNPWYNIAVSQTSGAEISEKVIQKFWMLLAPSALEYKVEGAREKLLAAAGATFGEIPESYVNTLDLSVDDGFMFSNKYNMWLNVTKSDAVSTPFTVGENDEIELIAGASYYLSDTKIDPQP